MGADGGGGAMGGAPGGAQGAGEGRARQVGRLRLAHRPLPASTVEPHSPLWARVSSCLYVSRESDALKKVRGNKFPTRSLNYSHL